MSRVEKQGSIRVPLIRRALAANPEGVEHLVQRHTKGGNKFLSHRIQMKRGGKRETDPTLPVRIDCHYGPWT